MEITLSSKAELLFSHIKFFQVLLYNSHNLTSVIYLYSVCSLWLIDRILSGATTPSQCGLGSNDNEGVQHIPQTSKAGALPSDGLMSYVGNSLVGVSCTFGEMQLVYSIVPSDWLSSTGVQTR